MSSPLSMLFSTYGGQPLKLSVWLPSLKNWIDQNVVIDSYSLGTPEIDQTLGFIAPLRDVSYRELDEGTIVGSATQDIFIRKRFSAEVLYQNLPIASLEGLHCSLMLRLVRQYRDIADIFNLEAPNNPNPLKLEELGDQDWLVEVYWTFFFEWMAEPETGNLGKTYNINRINVNVNRDLLDGTDTRLDFTMSLLRS